MNAIIVQKYWVTAIAQYLILTFDVCVNSFAGFSRQYPINLLILYMVQDFCLIMTLTVLLANFFSTYIFQVGLIQLLYTKFRTTLILCIIYMILSISLHIWDVRIHWSEPLRHNWTKEFHVLYSLHKGVAVLYYYFYKRASLRIADPRFYEGSTWIQNQSILS